MQYWVHINGVQRGPMLLDELIGLGITAETYIWREGLADWVKAREVPELTGYFTMPTNDNNTLTEASGHCENDFVVGESEMVSDNELNSPKDNPVIQQTNNDIINDQIQKERQMPQTQQSAFQLQHNISSCPPTNLVWAIIVTVLCCQIFGIIAIVYAAQVKSKYDMGQYEKAVKYSENAALWCKLGIALGLVWITIYSTIIPFLELMSL